MRTLPIKEFRKKILRAQPDAPDNFIIVDTPTQQLHLIEGGSLQQSFTISTSRYGTGNREGSQQTPPGLHRIVQKIGAGAPSGRIFRDRVDTGADWHIGLTEDNLILTRILRLEGLEEGINRGPGIDSFDRYIYLHGTNHEQSIGTPMSHGCVCMKNNDIIELFDRITEGTLVIID